MWKICRVNDLVSSTNQWPKMKSIKKERTPLMYKNLKRQINSMSHVDFASNLNKSAVKKVLRQYGKPEY